MGGQGVERRDILRFIGIASVAGAFPGFSKWAFACAQAHEIGNEAQNRFLSGLDWINARSKSEFGHEFMDCPPEQQKSLLEELAYKAKFKPTTESGREFFQFMRDYTVVGYYTTRIGLESLGYPGLRTVWPSMPGCSHPDDPEHIHLREPGKV